MITSETYTARRQELSKLIRKPIVLSANSAMQAAADVAFKFIQDASFYYYTGITEQDWKLIFDGETWQLVAPHISDIHAIFDGALGEDEARRISGVETIIKNEAYHGLLNELAKKYDTVAVVGRDPSEEHYDFHQNPARGLLEAELTEIFTNVYDCRLDINKQRAIKSSDELAEIQQAINVTVSAFEKLKNQLPSMKHEYELEALLSYEYRQVGLDGHAYDPIVAGGKNACTLHYVKNNDKLPSNGLVLIDSAAKSKGYAADITRTYAIGEPSKREVAVHKAVEEAQQKIIALLRPGLSVKEYHQKVDEIMKSALKSLGLLKTTDDYRKYFSHSVSHGLGLDVHDPLGRPEVFAPGMVLTVEPGIYIPEEGIGVRIEDDILITETGFENLSAELSTSL